MVNNEFLSVLAIVESRLEGVVDWAVVGSANLSLQGIEIDPNDLDIAVRFEDLEKIKKIFSDFDCSNVVEIESKSGKPVWELQIVIHSVGIQFNGEKEEGIYIDDVKNKSWIYVEKNGVKIPCLKLESELKAYGEMNRQDKIDKIREFIQDKA